MRQTIKDENPKPRQDRQAAHEVEVKALGQAAARLSLEALRLSRLAAELSRHDREAAA
jgi:hypothetical protein